MINNDISLQYNFTMRCSNKCDYCWHYEKINNYYEPTLENIDSLVDHLRVYSINDFILSGGELSINDKTFYIIDKVMNKLKPKRIKLLTNAYNKKFFERLKSDYDESYFNIHMSLHPQFYSDRYVENYLYVKENFSDFKLSLMLDKRYKENIYQFYPIYKEHFIGNTYFITISDNDNTHGTISCVVTKSKYTDVSFLNEVAKLYQIDLYSQIIGWKKVPEMYKNKTCINKFFFINPDGSIKFDDCYKQFKNSNDNIYEKEYHFPFHKITCKYTYQSCRMCSNSDYIEHEL